MIFATVGNSVVFTVGKQYSSLMIAEVGVTSSIPTTLSIACPPLQSAAILFSATGLFTVVGENSSTGEYEVVERVQVSSQDLFSVLKDLTDVSLGNWSWDKRSNILTLYRAEGTVQATFTALSTPDLSSRQRLT